jgi:tetratricopeptide (TPR) repeat protein
MDRQFLAVSMGIVSALIFGACGGEETKLETVSSEIPRVADLSGLDPAVAQLIENAVAAIEAEPKAALPRAGLGMIYQANEMFEPSRLAYRQALAIEPQNARWLYHLARVEERLSDVDAAIATIGRSIELEPRYAPSYWRRGGWLLNLDRAVEAEADFRKAIEIAPGDPAGNTGLARALITQAREQEAAKILEQQLLELPDDPLIHLLLGNAYRALGRLDEAERHLLRGQGESVIREDAWTANDILRFKLSFGAQIRMAVTLFGAGQMEQAIGIFERLRQRDPEDTRLLRHLGRAYMVVGRDEEGLATLDRGLELHPEDFKMLGEAAVAYHGAGKSEYALELLDRALAIQPEDGLTLARRGVILQMFKRYPEAVESFRRALVQRPQDVVLLRRYGDCFGHMGQYETAVAAYRDALRFDENDAEVLARLGFMLNRLGRLAEAEPALDKALELKPGNPQWAKLLEEIRRANANQG